MHFLIIFSAQSAWIFPSDNQQSGSVEHNYTTSSLSAHCRYLLANIDSLLFSTLDGGGGSAHSSRHFMEVAEGELVLLGRCKDHGALAGRSAVDSGDSVIDLDSSNTSATGKPYRFVCIQYFLSQPASDSNVSVADVHTVSIDADASAAENFAHLHREGLAVFTTAVQYLQQLGVEVVFCSDRVEEEAMCIATSHGLCVVSLLQLCVKAES